MIRRLLSVSTAAIVLSGCVSMAPQYDRPEAPVPGVAGEATAPNDSLVAWTDYFPDAELQSLIRSAQENNRDLRIAMLNAERARALYRVQRAEWVPNVSASSAYTWTEIGGTSQGVGGATGSHFESYNANVGLSGYELDLFGRVRSLNNEALATYFSTEEGRRAAEISLIADVASAYLTLAADRELLQIAQDTVENQQGAYDLAVRRLDAGVGNRTSVNRAMQSIESARADAAALRAQVKRDENALRLLLGTDLPPVERGQNVSMVELRRELPEGISSEVLLARPDVLSAEFDLRAANANIGAARAAFFPRISLTASGGASSSMLDNLFESGSETWSLSPSISVPIFTGGALRGNLEASKLRRDTAVASYERAIQSAFRETADALAVRETIGARLEAVERLVAATENTFALANEQYSVGVIDSLSVLDAQREFYAAQQQLVSVRLTEALNVVALYRALGGAAIDG